MGDKAMTIAEMLEKRGFNKGKAEGEKQAAEDFSYNLFREGMSLDFIARVSELPLERLREIETRFREEQ